LTDNKSYPKVLLHSVRKKEIVSFGGEEPRTKTRIYIVKKISSPLLPNGASSSSDNLEEKWFAKRCSSRGEHTGKVLTSIQSKFDRKPTTFCERAVPEKTVSCFP
jgi:hypothetical protein